MRGFIRTCAVAARVRAIHVLALTAALAAGCLADGSQPTTDLDDAAVAPDLRWSASSCSVHESDFAARGQDFDPFLPDGFTWDVDAAGTFLLRFTFLSCAADPSPSLAWIELPVHPPAALAGDGRASFLPIEAYAGQNETLEWLRSAGAGLAALCDCHGHALADDAVALEELQVVAQGHHYSLMPTLRPQEASSPARETARFFAQDDGSVRVVTEHRSEARLVGDGLVQFSHEGDGGSPPSHAGTVRKFVDATVTLRALPLDATT